MSDHLVKAGTVSNLLTVWQTKQSSLYIRRKGKEVKHSWTYLVT